jgi:hypothetical protein
MTPPSLQQADLSDPQSVSVIEQVDLLLVLFESHARNEDHFFNEPLEQSHPEVAKLFEKEHEEDHRLGVVISGLTDSWKKAGKKEKRAEIGKHLFYAFNEFVAFNLYHMNKEEIKLNEVLWREYSDVSIKATEQALVQSISPEKMAVYAKWMVRGANNAEILKWLDEVKEICPCSRF